MTRKRRQLIFIPAIALLASISSCKKDDIACPVDETVEATLRWTGDYAVDGCGYMLQIGDITHKPENESDIPNSYKETSPTPVRVRIKDYRKNVKACQSGIDINSVKILDIQKM